MSKPGRQVRWVHVQAHINVHGNEVASGLVMEGMCSNPLWSGSHVAQEIREELELRPMDRDEVTSSRAASAEDTQTACSDDSQEDITEGVTDDLLHQFVASRCRLRHVQLSKFPHARLVCPKC